MTTVQSSTFGGPASASVAEYRPRVDELRRIPSGCAQVPSSVSDAEFLNSRAVSRTIPAGGGRGPPSIECSYFDGTDPRFVHLIGKLFDVSWIRRQDNASSLASRNGDDDRINSVLNAGHPTLAF